MRDWAKLCRCVSSSPFLAAPDLTGNTSAELGPVPRTPPGLKNFTCWEVSSAAMDAIKKKMQAMKVEKDNAMDRSDVCEQAAKDAKVRASKAEEDAELVKKAQQLEVELDKTHEELLTTTEKLKEKENSLSSTELEVNALNRRVQGLEGDLETCEDKLLLATQKL